LETLIKILLIILIVAFILRHFGKYILLFLASHVAKKYGANPDAFRQNAQPRQKKQPAQPEVEQVIPDEVGEYVEFEEVK
jgi:flagellar basal body-associated protein FliL